MALAFIPVIGFFSHKNIYFKTLITLTVLLLILQIKMIKKIDFYI